MAIDYIYTSPTSDYNLISMSEKQEEEAMEVTEVDNIFLDMFKGRNDITVERIQLEVKNSKYYKDATEKEITDAANRIYTKLQTINSEYIKWFEVLIALIFSSARLYDSNMVTILPKNNETA